MYYHYIGIVILPEEYYGDVLMEEMHKQRDKERKQSKIKEGEMICKYCGSEWQPWNKFYDMECCKQCHNEGKDIQKIKGEGDET